MNQPLLSPRLIGFDVLSDLVDRMTADSQKPFPPYNVVRIDTDTYLIEMAVAGFDADDIAIEREGDRLRVSASVEPTEDVRDYLHKGIALRSFKREFGLAPHIAITEATLRNGMLRIGLTREIPEAMKPQRIAIAPAG